MTPELLAHIRHIAALNKGRTHESVLLDEIDRLNVELAEARLSAEEAHDDHDERENA